MKHPTCHYFLLLSIIAALSLGCSAGDPGAGPPIAPMGGEAPTGLVVITLDTTRADRIGSYGYEGARTPNIDRLAARGVLFENAFTPVPLTVPAHASLMTGHQPPHHGVRANEDILLDEPNLTLAEVLGKQGFRTGAFVGSAMLERWAGLDQGFETYGDDFGDDTSSVSFHYAEKRAAEVIAPAADWLSKVGDDPFFLWIHLFDPHGPYRAPDDFEQDFEDEPYDGEIAYSDQQIGLLLDGVERSGLASRTLVAFLSDHGEGLGEHGEMTHGVFLYDTTLRIPFILSYPALLPQRTRVPAQIAIVDFMPTVLDLLDVGGEVDTGGRSLLPLIAGGEADRTVAAYAETHDPLTSHGWSPLYSLRRGQWKVVHAPRPELYDLANDPSETRNLYDERRELAEELLAELRELERLSARDLDASSTPLDPERIKALQSQGYVGAGSTVEAPEGPLTDPKDRVTTLQELGRARRLLSQKRSREALELLVVLAEREPRSPRILELTGSTMLRGRDFDGAETMYERLLELEPRHGDALLNLGLINMNARESGPAIEYFERALEVLPDDPQVLVSLGQLYFMVLGETEKGRPYFERFLEISPTGKTARRVRKALAEEERESPQE